jgi:hypothetical protein
VDIGEDGLAILWMVTPTQLQGWTLNEAQDALVTLRFTFPVVSVSQVRALCMGGVHYIFFTDQGRTWGYRWFSGMDAPVYIYDETGLSAFDLLSHHDLPYLAKAKGVDLALFPLTDVGATIFLTSPITVVEMAVHSAGALFSWVVTDLTSGIQVNTGAVGGGGELTGTSWHSESFQYVDGVATVCDPVTSTVFVWAGFVLDPINGPDRYTKAWSESRGVWTDLDNIPDSRPASGAFMAEPEQGSPVPALWLSRPNPTLDITNPVGWLHLAGAPWEESPKSSVGASAYHGYGLTPNRTVLPAPVPLDSDLSRWSFVEASTAYSYLAGLTGPPPASGVLVPPPVDGQGPVTVLTLDFSEGAVLSQARLGGAVYLAGGQPHGFDGTRAYEAGFNGFPVVISEAVGTMSGTGESLDSGDTRSYRAYLVWRNASGELVYSDADIYNSQHAASPSPRANRTLIFSFSCPASELYEQAWVEVYGTTGGGGVIGSTYYQLVSEGDGVLLYQNGDLTFTLVDSLSDATLQGGTRAVDPYNPSLTAPFNLAPGFWPACDSVTMAGDRIWLAGGLVPKGTLSFTKLRTFGVGVEHTEGYGLLEVSSAQDPVEWVSPVQDSVLAVAGGFLYAFGGQGPDNTGLGAFGGAVRLSGGISGVRRSVVSDEGVWLMAVSGCLLVGPGLAVTDVSDTISSVLSRELADGDVLYAEYDAVNNEIRWYATTGTVFVLDRNVQAIRWAFWRLPRVVGGSLGAALLITADGRWLDVTPGHTTDAGQPIQAVVATADLTPLEGGQSRFRHYLVTGVWLPANTKGKLTVTAHYDGADYRSSLNWFDGPDNTRPLSQWFSRVGVTTQDALMRKRARFARQPGSSVRLRFTITGAPALLSQVTIDVTQPDGLARLPMK